MAAIFFALTAAYHGLTALVEFPLDATTYFVYTVVVAIFYGLLFVGLSRHFNENRPGVLKVFWRSTLYGAILFGVLEFVPWLSDKGSYANDTGVPIGLGSVFRTVVLSPLVIVYSMTVLFRLRELVLFKRTRRSVRQWYLMLIAMALASLAVYGADPALGINPFTGVMLGVSTILMVANSFRISRIVYLDLKEKASTIGFSVVLLAVLIMAVASDSSGLFPGDSYPFLRTYSPGLHLFALQCIVFGIMYCVTATLSLLFHLPTTGEFQQKAGELAALHSVARLTGEVLNKEKLVSTIVSSPIEAGMGDSAWLALTDLRSGSLRPHIAATHNISVDQITEMFDYDALYDEAAGQREPVVLNHAITDHRVKVRPGDRVSSMMIVPLRVRKEVLGALFLTKEVTQGFESNDVETVNTFADQAALVLDNARLFEEKIEQERLARELVIAREVQKKLLPQDVPTIAGLTVAALSVSAQEVGGDYYDFVEVDEKKWAFIVGDVSGKGTSAAFYMAEMKGVFRALSRLTDSPTTFLKYANRALVNSMEKNIFISVVYGVLDLETEVLTLARAGHCPVVVVNGHGQARFLRTDGLGLGLDQGELFASVLVEESISLKPGDVFVLYTDGVVESRSETGEEFGYDRLMEAVCRHHKKTASELHAALLSDLNRFLGKNQYDDDMTLLVLRWDGRETDLLDKTDAPDNLENEVSTPSPPTA